MTRICAWCLADMGDIAPEQTGVTHGICEKCKANLMAEKDGHNPLDGAGFHPPLTAPSFSEGLKCK